MATSHFARSVYKGQGARGVAAQRVLYITRHGEAEARITHQGLTSAHQSREDLVTWESANLPAWAEGDPVRYFSAAEQYEKATWTAYEEWKFSLPRELSEEQRLEAARGLLRGLFSDRQPHVWAMHNPLAADGLGQPHIHVIWSGRQVDSLERTPEQFFQLYNFRYPERGGAEKAKRMYQFGFVKEARVLYTDVMNLYLERAGHEARLHPDRLITRGITREPEPRLDPSDSNAAKFDHRYTKKMREVLAHRRIYGEAKAREQAGIAAYWEARKRTLGIERTMGREEVLTRLRGCYQTSRPAVTRDRETSTSRPHVPASGSRLSTPIIGNARSKIYHVATHKNYGDVHPHNQVFFWTEQEAIDAGYRRAKNDHYGPGTGKAMQPITRLPRSPWTHQRSNGWAVSPPRLAGVAGGMQGPGQGLAHGPQLPGSQLEREVAQLDRVIPLSGLDEKPDKPWGRAVKSRVFEEDHRERR